MIDLFQLHVREMSVRRGEKKAREAGDLDAFYFYFGNLEPVSGIFEILFLVFFLFSCVFVHSNHLFLLSTQVHWTFEMNKFN